jgi:hypothetical protein
MEKFTDISVDLTAAIFRVEEYATSACYFFFAGCFLGLIFDPEDGGNTFLRYVGKLYHTTRHRMLEDSTFHFVTC